MATLLPSPPPSKYLRWNIDVKGCKAGVCGCTTLDASLVFKIYFYTACGYGHLTLNLKICCPYWNEQGDHIKFHVGNIVEYISSTSPVWTLELLFLEKRVI